ncbi:MAG TPA: histidinol-phosphate transaminase [Anaeromyxobacteraceae bacterium]|nr:histidinol-phosphate transaminase [Anaeromyxobacteraceae bacterium]
MSWRDFLRQTLASLEVYRTHEYQPGLTRLDANESPFPLDRADLDAFARELGRIAIHRYPDVSGRPLRQAFARRLGVAPEQVLVANGSDEVISILVTAFAEGPRGRGAVLFPVPTFGEYESIALAHGAVPVKVPLGEGFALDEEGALAAIRREQPALCFFASPNNPTGNRFDAPALERLARETPGVFVADEAYADFAAQTMIPLVGAIEGFCVMRSLSKVGLAALRVGALVGPADLVAQLDKVRLPFNVNAVSMALACMVLGNPERLEARVREVAAARGELAAGLAAIPGLTVFPSDANFVLVRTPIDGQRAWQRLLERGVVVRNLSRPGPLANCLRVTAGTPEENQRCVDAMRAALA